MTYRLGRAHLGMLLGVGIMIGGATQARAADLATFNAAQFNLNGFTFDDFGVAGAVDTSGGLLSLNIIDNDAVNGAFGGAGSDITPNVAFDVVNTQIEVKLQVGTGNLAPTFRVVLIDEDGPFNGEEFFYEFDISSLTPLDGFVTLTSPMLTPLFSQTAFGLGPGDGIQNFGLRQVQVQTVFGAPEALIVDIESIKIVDPGDPTIARLDATTFNASGSSFTFGAMSAPGAVDVTGTNIIIDSVVQAGGDFPGSSFGGIGFNLPVINFDATQAEIVLNARLLANNDAATFRLQLSDTDPGGAGDDFVWTIDTADLNTSTFTEIVIPLGDGSADEILTTFGMTPGDLLQNFGLIGMQIQSEGVLAASRLNIEVESFLIREATSTPLDGDLNGDGFVGIGDLNIVLGNWNQNVANGDPLAGDPSGDGFVGISDLNIVLGNWNAGTPPPVASVPEPGTLLMLGMCGVVVLRRR